MGIVQQDAVPSPPDRSNGTRATQPGTIATFAMIVISAAVLLSALDQTVVVTALLPIANSFNLPANTNLHSLSWIVSGYLLGYVIVMPLMGHVSDLWGRKRVLLGTLLVFGSGSLLVAIAPILGNTVSLDFLSGIGIDSPNSGLTWMIIARFIQAVGGGAIVPVAVAAIGDFYGIAKRSMALGIIGGVTEAGGALGPLYGALVIEHWKVLPTPFDATWQWIFLLNVPIVAAIAFAIWRWWPATVVIAPAPAANRSIDWIGTLLLGGALAGISVGLGQEAGIIGNFQQASISQNNPFILLLALILLVLFVVAESRHSTPVIDLKMFRNGAFSAAALFSIVIGITLITALVNIPIYVLTATAADAYLDAGLALLRMTAMIPLGAITGGWLVARYGCRKIAILGSIFLTAGFFMMHFWTIPVNWNLLTISTVITGIGFGLVVAPISTTALNTTSIKQFGSAAAIVTALRMIGMIVGLAALSSWGVSHYAELAKQVPVPAILTNTDQFKIYADKLVLAAVQTLTDFFIISAVLALVAIIPAFFLWKPQEGEKNDQHISTFSIGF